jgi:hypothetical protein
LKDRILETEEELTEQIADLAKFENIELKELVQNAEIVFHAEHICNDNLKKKGKNEGFYEPEEIVEEYEKSKKSLKDLAKVSFSIKGISLMFMIVCRLMVKIQMMKSRELKATK